MLSPEKKDLGTTDDRLADSSILLKYQEHEFQGVSTFILLRRFNLMNDVTELPRGDVTLQLLYQRHKWDTRFPQQFQPRIAFKWAISKTGKSYLHRVWWIGDQSRGGAMHRVRGPESVRNSDDVIHRANFDNLWMEFRIMYVVSWCCNLMCYV